MGGPDEYSHPFPQYSWKSLKLQLFFTLLHNPEVLIVGSQQKVFNVP